MCAAKIHMHTRLEATFKFIEFSRMMLCYILISDQSFIPGGPKFKDKFSSTKKKVLY